MVQEQVIILGAGYRILYVGALAQGQTGLMRMEVLRELGHETTPVNTRPAGPTPWYRLPLGLVAHWFGYPPDRTGANRELIRAAESGNHDIAWVGSTYLFSRKTLKTVKRLRPQMRLVAFIMDDPFSSTVRGWRRFRVAATMYDVCLVIRDENIEELHRLGVKNVIRYHKGFAPHVHRPVELPPGYPRYDVLFAGHWEPKREEDIAYLIRHGIDVKIFGERHWRRKGRHWDVIGPSFGNAVYGEGYVKLLCASQIALCFYSQPNRDKENSRMYEIPACGAFMLCERNDENIHVFDEGREAEFFDSKEELLEKVRYYLDNDDAREKIAVAGRERCLTSGYGYRDRLKALVGEVLRVAGHGERA